MKKAFVVSLILIISLTGCARSAVQPTPQPTLPEDTPARSPQPTETLQPTSTNVPTETQEMLPEATIIAEPSGYFESGDCPFEVPPGAEIECGDVIVPADHDEPNGEIIRLAVVVLRDDSEQHQPDPVILLAGGPGEKVVENGLAVLGIMGDIHPNRDMILFDQRGVGLSEPALECPGWAQAQYNMLDEADELAVAESNYKVLMECRDQLLDAGIDLSNYNTSQSAADVNAIREALGYEQLNIFGGSYGSFLAQAVVRAYPQMVRSVAMNSVYPLDTSFIVESPLVTSQGVLDLLAACEKDQECNQAYPNLTEVLFETIERLNQEPVMIQVTHATTGETYDVLLTGDRVYSNLLGFMYITQFIPLLPQAIYDVYDGKYDLMAQLQGTYLSLFEATSRGMMYSVLCTEDLINKEWEDLKANAEAVPIPLSENIDFEDTKPYSIFAICEAWGVEQAPASFKEPLVSEIPSLLLGGEFDPVTPIEYAEQVAENLNHSYLYEFPSVGHNIMAASACARQTMGAFFENPDQAPAASCRNEVVYGFAVPYQDPGGQYSFPLPPGWTAWEEQGYTQVSSAEGEITGYVVVLAGEDLEANAYAAWEIINPEFEGEASVVERPCQGCVSAAADKFALIPFNTGDPEEVIIGAGWVYTGQTYMTLWVSDPKTMEQQGETLNTILIGFKIIALESSADTN